MDDFKDADASRASSFQLPVKPASEEGSSTNHETSGLQEDGASDPGQSKGILNSVLHFLSTSSNEALLCVFAFSMVMVYLLLGRLGLILIGTVLGVILHASWEGMSNEATGKPNARRGESALHVANRLLDWPSRKSPETFDTKISRESSIDLDYSTFRPKTAVALKSLTDAVIKDYVK